MRIDPFAGLLLCPICRRDWSDASGCCPRCRSNLFRPIGFPALTALGYYRGDLRRAIRAYKFQGTSRMAALFAAALASAVGKQGWRPEVVSHVPLHRRRASMRGYDQARLLAEEVAERLRLPWQAALERTRDTTQQARLRARDRPRNVRGAFRPLGVQPAVVLLIDDVLTTGATLAECRAALQAAGAHTVLFAVLALAPPPASRDSASGPSGVRGSRQRRW